MLSLVLPAAVLFGVMGVVALARPSERGGVFLSLGVALWGMALGRLVSLALDRRGSSVVWLSLAGELVLGACLAAAWARSG